MRSVNGRGTSLGVKIMCGILAGALIIGIAATLILVVVGM